MPKRVAYRIFDSTIVEKLDVTSKHQDKPFIGVPMQNHFHSNKDDLKANQYHTYQNDHDRSKSYHMMTQDCINELKSEIQKLKQVITENQVPMQKEYYSVKEVAKIIDRAEFTVREYCNNKRIIAEKKDSGRGSSNEWKISYEELNHYLNHGLRPR